MFMAFQLPSFSQHQDEGDSTEEQRHACQAQPQNGPLRQAQEAVGLGISVAIAVSKKTNTMPAVATTKLTAPTASGASRSARNSALTAP